MADPDIDRALQNALRDPRAWLGHAEQLKCAADALFDQFRKDVAGLIGLASLDQASSAITEIASNDARAPLSEFSLGGPYLMVAGYAIENLAKGLIVARDKRASTIQKITNAHVSPQLLGWAGVTLIDGEPDLVERMQVRVQWAGRYPVPKLAADLSAAREPNLWRSVLRVSTTDGEMVDALFERMVAALTAASDGSRL